MLQVYVYLRYRLQSFCSKTVVLLAVSRRLLHQDWIQCRPSVTTLTSKPPPENCSSATVAFGGDWDVIVAVDVWHWAKSWSTERLLTVARQTQYAIQKRHSA